MKVSAQQVAQYAAAAGWTGYQLTVAVAISFAENGAHDTEAKHHNADGSTDYGLWQVNSVHRIPTSQLLDGQGNANAAYAISGHGIDFTPWVTYGSGAYSAHLGAAQQAIDSAHIQGQGSAGGVTGALGDAGNSLHGAEQAANPLKWGATLATFLGRLLDRSTWIRLVEIVAGLVLGAGALFLLGRSVAAEQVGGILKGR